MLGNLGKLITGRGTHRPSPWIGMQLLFTGQFGKFHRQLVTNVEDTTAVSEYDLWRKRHAITDERRQQMRDAIAATGATEPPLISVVMPVYNVAEVYLRAAIESVRRQTYCRTGSCASPTTLSPKPHVRRVLNEYAKLDPRIKVDGPAEGQRQHLGRVSNSALELATGRRTSPCSTTMTSWPSTPCSPSPSGSRLTRRWTWFTATRTRSRRPASTSTRSSSPTGRRSTSWPACTPATWACTARRWCGRSADGGRRSTPAQDYDLVLRIVATKPKVAHVADVLYHWRTIPTSTAAGAGAKPEAHERARAALADHITVDIGRPGHGARRAQRRAFTGSGYAIRGKPRVSLVIPSACREVEVRGRQHVVRARVRQQHPPAVDVRQPRDHRRRQPRHERRAGRCA